MSVRIVRHPAALRAAREAIAHGLLNFGHAVERDWKADAVVRGGHRSFMTGPRTKAGTPRIGGTFRRSIHTVAYLDGARLGASAASDENGTALPSYAPGAGMAVVVGSNSGYGAYVELGTARMPARPAAVPALQKNRGAAVELIRAGARRHLGEGGSR